MRAAWHRVRAYAGHFAALAALVAAACALLTAVPRFGTQVASEGLTAQLTAAPPAVRSVTYSDDNFDDSTTVSDGPAKLSQLLHGMPRVVRDVVGERWYSADIYPEDDVATGRDLHPDVQRIVLGLHASPGIENAVRMVAGRLPHTAEPSDAPDAPDAVVEVAVAERVAKKLRLTVGARFTMSPKVAAGRGSNARIVGVFAPRDERADRWTLGQPPMLDVGLPASDRAPLSAWALTDPAGISTLAGHAWWVHHSWMYRVEPRRISIDTLDDLLDGLAKVETSRNGTIAPAAPVHEPLQRFADDVASVEGSSAAVLSGVVAAVIGLLAFLAALMVYRRRAEIDLLRSRGAGVPAIARRSLAESGLVAVPSAALGCAVGLAVPGAHTPFTAPLVVSVAALALVVVPVSTARYAYGAGGGPTERATARRRSPARLVVEVLLVLLAAAGTALVRGRGLGDGVDGFLAVVPVLLAVSTAVVAVRVLPWLLRPVGWRVARLRGAALFLGVARAGRLGQTVLGPAVVVIAVTTATFSAAVAGGVANARDQAADGAVPGDALVTASSELSPAELSRFATAPGVGAAARLAVVPGGSVRPPGTGASSDQQVMATVVVVDPVALEAVRARSGHGVALPAALSRPPGPDGIPALVSPALADRLPGRGQVELDNRWRTFRIAGTVEGFPGVPAGQRDVLLVPWSAVASGAHPLPPTGLALAGPHAHLPPPDGLSIVRWSEYRAQLDTYGMHPALSFVLWTGALAGLLCALLALALSVLAGADERARLLAQLRPLGFAPRQWWIVLGLEPGLPALVTVLAGALAGAAVPYALGPALRLSAAAGGVGVSAGVGGALAASLAGFAAFAVLTVILVGAAARHRRTLFEAGGA